MQVFISAGEVSGDHHAAGLVREVKALLPEVNFWGLGGKKMAEEGVQLVKDMEEFGVVGLDGVLQKVPEFYKLTSLIVDNVYRSNTRFAIFVDYPGYNIYLASHLKKVGVKNFYFIAPQVWGWWSFRAKLIKRYFERVFVIYPFEEKFYRMFSVDAIYVGNPVVDTIRGEGEECKIQVPSGKKIVGFLPGSRITEIKRLLPKMLEIKELLENRHSDLHFILSLVSSSMHVSSHKNLTIVRKMGRDVIRCSDALVIASGTATMEAALLQKPFVVLYELSTLSYIIGSIVRRTEFLSLANIIAGKEVVREFIQHIHPEEVAEVVEGCLYDDKIREKIKREFEPFKLILKGSAYKNAAKYIKKEVLNYEND